jgi:hypothetical protein
MKGPLPQKKIGKRTWKIHLLKTHRGLNFFLTQKPGQASVFFLGTQANVLRLKSFGTAISYPMRVEHTHCTHKINQFNERLD